MHKEWDMSAKPRVGMTSQPPAAMLCKACCNAQPTRRSQPTLEGLQQAGCDDEQPHDGADQQAAQEDQPHQPEGRLGLRPLRGGRQKIGKHDSESTT